MTFKVFRASVKGLIDEALRDMGVGVVNYQIEEPPIPNFGDLAVNVAFQLSKRFKEPPGKVAEDLVSRISGRLPRIVASVSAHPTGYINFTVEADELTYLTMKAAFEEGYGSMDIGRGRKVVVEHTSVNPNKALHVGHARNVVLGDSIARILRKVGYRVEVLNYIDDTGTQVADVIVGFLHIGIPEEPGPVKYDRYCGDDVYIKVNEIYEENPKLEDKRREVITQLEKGIGPAVEVAKRVVPKVVKAQLETCWRLGARYDLLNWESHIIRLGLWDVAFNELRKRNAVKRVDEGRLAGCWVLKASGKDEEKVLVRSDGTTVYAAKDIPYAAWKLGLLPDPFKYSMFADQPDGTVLWTTVERDGNPDHPPFGSADMAITVIDVRQSRVQEYVAYATKLLGGGHKEYKHLGYDVVALSRVSAEKLGLHVPPGRQFVHMSGRRGSYVNVDDVLDALKERAVEEVAKRNPGASPGWIDLTAERIAVGALRYQLLRQDPNKMIIFDMDEALKLEGETGPYLQYTYARASRIVEKSGTSSPPQITKEKARTLREPEEIDLMKEISKYELELELAARTLSTKGMAIYSYRLADHFNSFYERHRVIQEPREDVRGTRLALVYAFRITLREVLELLGVPPLEKI